LAGSQTGVLELPYQASAAITKLRFVVLTGDQTVGPCSAITDKALGVARVDISTAEATAGKSVAVQVLGVAWMECAAAITRGNFVGPATDGRAQTAVSTQFVRGMALKTTANAGEWLPVLLVDIAHSAL